MVHIRGRRVIMGGVCYCCYRPFPNAYTDKVTTYIDMKTITTTYSDMRPFLSGWVWGVVSIWVVPCHHGCCLLLLFYRPCPYAGSRFHEWPCPYTVKNGET